MKKLHFVLKFSGVFVVVKAEVESGHVENQTDPLALILIFFFGSGAEFRLDPTLWKTVILNVPKVIANLYCICLSEHETFAKADAI